MYMRVPAPNAQRVQDYPSLTGGLNLRDLPYLLPANQSPLMKNLRFCHGMLQCRPGQEIVSSGPSAGTGYTCTGRPFYGSVFLHIGPAIWRLPAHGGAMEKVIDGIPENRGTFFRYQDYLLYKNKGSYTIIRYDPEGEPAFTAAPVADEAYVPVVAINVKQSKYSSELSAGDPYQPENRLSAKKTIRYDAASLRPGSGIPLIEDVREPGAILSVVSDGVALQEGSASDPGYFSWGPTGYPSDLWSLHLNKADYPEVSFEVTYQNPNPDAFNSIMECRYATVSGGDRDLCILLAGCEVQPDAVFWNANDSVSMNPLYYPISNYNLVGDTADPVTGFGEQYGDTIVFKANSVGKLDFRIDTIQNRNTPGFGYTSINDEIGCDCPWSIQLIENNLVFANSARGIFTVRSSSAALENNIECLSQQVNAHAEAGSPIFGMLDVLTGPKDMISSWDDDELYWICSGGQAYVLDYSLREKTGPSWFYFDNVQPRAFYLDEEHRGYYLRTSGEVVRFNKSCSDFGKGIDKVYQFPVTNFGTYERRKDVDWVLISMRSDTTSCVSLQYDTDFETRMDLTRLCSWRWSLAGFCNLAVPVLGFYNKVSPRYASILKRRPQCRGVQHFTMTLRNDAPGEDLALISAQVIYSLREKER